MRLLAFALAGLLSISCTANEGEQPTPTTPGVRVLSTKPVEEIAINEPWCDETARCIHDWGGQLEEHRPEARALVAELRRDSPSWLRYVQAVDLQLIRAYTPGTSVIWMDGPPQPLPYVRIRTGIARNKPGIEVARTICQSVLDRGIWGVSVVGRVSANMPLSYFNSAVVAECNVMDEVTEKSVKKS